MVRAVRDQFLLAESSLPPPSIRDMDNTGDGIHVLDNDNDDDVNEAIVSGQDLINAILDRAPYDTLKAKIDAGAPLWFQDDEGASPLHAAVYTENSRLVRYLVENGALWNAGECSCHLARRSAGHNI